MGKQIAVLRYDGPVYCAAFSPDGTRVVTASRDKTAHLWDAATAQEIANLPGHDGRVYKPAISPDGTHVVTASDDGTARLWNIGTISKGNLFQIACAWLPDQGCSTLCTESQMQHHSTF